MTGKTLIKWCSVSLISLSKMLWIIGKSLKNDVVGFSCHAQKIFPIFLVISNDLKKLNKIRVKSFKKFFMCGAFFLRLCQPQIKKTAHDIFGRLKTLKEFCFSKKQRLIVDIKFICWGFVSYENMAKCIIAQEFRECFNQKGDIKYINKCLAMLSISSEEIGNQVSIYFSRRDFLLLIKLTLWTFCYNFSMWQYSVY